MVLVIAFLFAMGNAWLGWALVLLILLLSPWYALLMRFQPREVVAFVIIMYAHLAMAIVCFYFLPQLVLMFGVDANGFVREALQQSPFPFGVGSGAYVNFLRIFVVYSPSVFSLYMTSVVAVALSCAVLLRVLYLLNVRSHFMLILLFSTLVPTDIISTSIALREPWQVLFVMCSVYFSFQVWCCARPVRIFYMIGLFVSLCFLGMLHKGLIYVSFIWPFLFLFVSWFIRGFERIDFVIKLLVILLVLMLGCVILAYLAQHFVSLADAALSYGGRVNKAASSYMVFFQAGDGFITNLFHLPLALLYYWFYPFPWDIHRVKDIYGCLVGFMRLFFILYAFYFVLTSPESRQRHLGGALLVVLLMISMIFAIGTSNYGTSLRHNILTFWGFVALGVPGFYLHRYRRRCRRLGVAP